MAKTRTSIFEVRGYIVLDTLSDNEVVHELEQELLRGLENSSNGFTGEVIHRPNLIESIVEIKPKKKKQ